MFRIILLWVVFYSLDQNHRSCWQFVSYNMSSGVLWTYQCKYRSQTVFHVRLMFFNFIRSWSVYWAILSISISIVMLHTYHVFCALAIAESVAHGACWKQNQTMQCGHIRCFARSKLLFPYHLYFFLAVHSISKNNFHCRKFRNPKTPNHRFFQDFGVNLELRCVFFNFAIVCKTPQTDCAKSICD